MFLLDFDNGGFFEDTAFGMGERFAHAPGCFPAGNVSAPKSANAGISSGERSALAVRRAAGDGETHRPGVDV